MQILLKACEKTTDGLFQEFIYSAAESPERDSAVFVS